VWWHFVGYLHDLPAVAGDGNVLRAGGLATFDGLQLVLAGAETEFFGAGAGDDEFFAIDEDMDAGVIDFDHQRAVAADDADDGGGDVRDPRRFGHSECRTKHQHNRGSD
jgi:hypothetical protein